jgi:hypothetical protein
MECIMIRNQKEPGAARVFYIALGKWQIGVAGALTPIVLLLLAPPVSTPRASLDDPVAAVMLHDLVGYTASAFAPQTELRDGGLRKIAAAPAALDSGSVGVCNGGNEQ